MAYLIKAVEKIRENPDDHKVYENNYQTGWIDACNAVLQFLHDTSNLQDVCINRCQLNTWDNFYASKGFTYTGMRYHSIKDGKGLRLHEVTRRYQENNTSDFEPFSGKGYCDEQGRCWFQQYGKWILAHPGSVVNTVCCLPAHINPDTQP